MFGFIGASFRVFKSNTLIILSVSQPDARAPLLHLSILEKKPPTKKGAEFQLDFLRDGFFHGFENMTR